MDSVRPPYGLPTDELDADLEGCGPGWSRLLILHPLPRALPLAGADIPPLPARIAQLSAMDVSAWTTTKGAAKCGNHCELQNPANQQELERSLRFRDMPESVPVSVSEQSVAGTVQSGVFPCAKALGSSPALGALEAWSSPAAKQLEDRKCLATAGTPCCPACLGGLCPSPAP